MAPRKSIAVAGQGRTAKAAANASDETLFNVSFQGYDDVIQSPRNDGEGFNYRRNFRSLDQFFDEEESDGRSDVRTSPESKKITISGRRCYKSKALVGKTLEQLADLMNGLTLYDAWMPKAQQWMPCIYYSAQRAAEETMDFRA